jgi:putative copper export protein
VDEIDWVGLASRWVHLVMGSIAVGGTAFQYFAVAPSAGELDPSSAAKLQAAIRGRWAKWVHLSIGFLLLTGFYNFFLRMWAFDMKGSPYHMLFGLKFLLALGMFFVASLLAGRSAAADRFRQQAPRWLLINLGLGLAIVAVGGVLRALDLPEKAAQPAPVAAANTPIGPA